MKVSELIEKLKKMPQDAAVGYIWDGMARSSVLYLWVSKTGQLLLSDGDYVYYDDDRPSSAPLRSDVPFWNPPKSTK